MQPLDITEPLDAYVAQVSKSLPTLAAAYRKVKKPLRRYAAQIDTTLQSLTMLDVWTESGELRPDLLHCIEGLPKPIKSSAERHKANKGEIASRLRGIYKMLILLKSGNVGVPDWGNAAIPDFLLPVWRLLPREGANRIRRKPYEAVDDSRLKQLPLTEQGKQLLKIFFHVAKQHEIPTVELLFNEHSDSIRLALRELCPVSMWPALETQVGVIRRKLHIVIQAGEKICVPLEDFPPTLRLQCENFIRAAPTGLVNHAICSKAKRHNVSVGPLEKKTVDNYIHAIGQALFKITYESDLSIKDLLRVTLIEHKDEDGNIELEFHNALVDYFREQQSRLVTEYKHEGFDTALFRSFTHAIKAVAAYNGIFHLHKNFNKGYIIREDEERKREIKDLKKKLFDLPWIDAQITQLGVEFHRVVRERSFRADIEGIGLPLARRSLRLCLFYVALVTLRYMGYRQQALRNCVLGENIIFKLDGTVVFHYEASMVKNDRAIHAEISPHRHSETHAVLLDALSTYYKHVYPYLRKMCGAELNGQFFVSLTVTGTKVKPWDACDSKRFRKWFRRAGLSFLNFGDRLLRWGPSMNPHFLRGLCADWLINVLGLSFAEAAEYLGDTEETIRKEYVDRHRILNATPVLDAAAAKARGRKNVEHVEGWAAQLNTLLTEIARRDRIIERLEGQVRLANEGFFAGESRG